MARLRVSQEAGIWLEVEGPSQGACSCEVAAGLKASGTHSRGGELVSTFGREEDQRIGGIFLKPPHWETASSGFCL